VEEGREGEGEREREIGMVVNLHPCDAGMLVV
jgi:hypothetical protein